MFRDAVASGRRSTVGILADGGGHGLASADDGGEGLGEGRGEVKVEVKRKLEEKECREAKTPRPVPLLR